MLMVSISILISCGNRQEIAYFQTNEDIISNFENNIPRIQSSDQLAIVVSAADPKAILPFNPQNSMNVAINNTSPYTPTYTVDSEGYVNMPMIGKIKIGGLTRSQATDLLQKRISEYVINPGVVINFTNFRISVLGEVLRPGSFIVPTERITLLEALGLAGDLTIKGKRENVTVIREIDGVKQKYIVDLTSNSALSSPVYYLNQNDVIYVEPNSAQVAASRFTPNYSLWISMAGVIISVISVLTR